MKEYTQWDYSNSFSMADNTKMGIYYIFKEGDLKKITDFLSSQGVKLLPSGRGCKPTKPLGLLLNKT